MQWIKTWQVETAVIGKWTSLPHWGPLSRAPSLSGLHHPRDQAGSDVGFGLCLSVSRWMGTPLHMEVDPAHVGWEVDSHMGPQSCFIPWLLVGNDQLVDYVGSGSRTVTERWRVDPLLSEKATVCDSEELVLSQTTGETRLMLSESSAWNIYTTHKHICTHFYCDQLQ